MLISRREFVAQAAIVSAVAPALVTRAATSAAAPLPVRIGMTDWNLGKRGDITKIALAREIGLDGIQVSLTFPTDGSPHLREPKTQAAFKQAALEHGIQICSLAIGSPGKSRLPLHTNPAAAILLVEAVEVARNLGTTNILLPILGDSHIHMDNAAGGRHVRRDDEGSRALRREGGRRGRARRLDLGRRQPAAARCHRFGFRRRVLRRAQHQVARARSLRRAGAARQAHQPGARQERTEVDAGQRHPRLAAAGAGVSRHRLPRLVRARDRRAVERPDRRHPREHRLRAQDVQDAGSESERHIRCSDGGAA